MRANMTRAVARRMTNEKMTREETSRRKACRGQVYPSCSPDKSGEVTSRTHQASRDGKTTKRKMHGYESPNRSGRAIDKQSYFSSRNFRIRMSPC